MPISDNEGDRFRLRETIASILRPWFASRDFATVRSLLDDAKVLWSPYRDMAEVVAHELADCESIVAEVQQPGVGPMLSSAAPWSWDGTRAAAVAAPLLASDTDEVLTAVLGMTSAELGRLRTAKIVG